MCPPGMRNLEVRADAASLPRTTLRRRTPGRRRRAPFVSSANFTTRGQDRNIETGVLLEDPHFARQLEGQWLSLVSAGLVLRG